MGIAGRLQETWYRATGRTQLAEALRQERETRQLLEESVSDLEARLHEPGWQRLTQLAEQEFSREGLGQMAAVCRVMAIKNPLIKRGMNLRRSYVWGQGVSIMGRDDGSESGQDVNTLVQDFLDTNRDTFTSHQARAELETGLATDGSLFLALFTNPRTGRVRVRVIPFDQVQEVITDPDDASQRQYYRRVWTSEHLDPATGNSQYTYQTVYYPDVSYRPRRRPRSIGGHPVMWDAPIVHVRVNTLTGWRYGIPDVYAAVDWARAYKEFLEDWARLVKSLSRFAWRLTSKGSKQAQAKQRLAQPPPRDSATGEAHDAGATASMTPDMQLEAVPKSGATIDSESGRPLAMMVASALDVPVTMLLSDPGQTGARATAETLDAPVKLMAADRRELWADAHRTILDYVIDQAAKAPQGPLQGTIRRDPQDPDREFVDLAGQADRTIEITWPDIDEMDPVKIVEAITKADQTTYLPPLTIARLLLEALGVNEVDEILDQLQDEQGNFQPPEGAGGMAGQAAVDAFRRGEDPAATLNGGQGNEGNGNEGQE